MGCCLGCMNEIREIYIEANFVSEINWVERFEVNSESNYFYDKEISIPIINIDGDDNGEK